MSFNRENKEPKRFEKITISLASPEQIKNMSSGEVTKPETINYRTLKPERDGLFCEKIFGPVKSYECACGKYKRVRYRGIICDRCGVEVTDKKVRRERMGHISLVVPVAHIWFFKSLPSKIGHLLGLPTKTLQSIVYYEKYVVIQPGVAVGPEGVQLNQLDFLSEEEYLDILDALPPENRMLDELDPNKFVAKMGAEALTSLLSRIDLAELAFELRDKAANETSQQRKSEALKRLQVVEAFKAANKHIENRPEWMIIKEVPVIPPELRPLLPLDGGRFATSDLNELYRRVIIRNNRLKKLVEIRAPEVILRNEKRMLQEAVDSLFDNSKKASAVKTKDQRPLKSLSDSLKGKQGRFRMNLLGKRVDYSARSVIVVGPSLKLHECGIPKEMAAELYKPFIIRKLIQRGITSTVKLAKKIVEDREPIVWEILENVLKGHPVLLNRAPTLHRLGIQAFQPKLIEGKALQLHPLACTAFNADFDGDQMAVHLPLGNAAVLEAQMLMLASHNILNPANGAPIAVPSQDMVLGLYYISKGKKSVPGEPVKGEGKTFYSAEEVNIAYNEKQLDLHAYIKIRVVSKDAEGNETAEIIETTTGRVLFNERVPEGAGYINETLTKKALRNIIGRVLKKVGIAKTAKFLDDIKELGFMSAFYGGLSFNLADVIIPPEKDEYVAAATEQVAEVMTNYSMGLITNNERYNQIIDIWTHTNSKLTNTLMENLKNDRQGFNSIYMMFDSGARGSKEQIRQLSGMRGLMAKPQKSGATGQEIIENPILANFKEGLSVLEYFISTHGARKGLADTALKTADAGYLTRRLVDVAQDVVVTTEDCGTLRGIVAAPLIKNDEIVESLIERIIGRTPVNDVYNDEGDLIVASGEEITPDIADIIDAAGIDELEIRSVLTCENEAGICSKCYGTNLANNDMVQMGEAVGVIAAQSIGEPGTQLTLRTFHVGGTASNVADESELKIKNRGKLEFEELRSVKRKESDGKEVEVVINRNSEARIVDPKTNVVITTHNIPYGAILMAKNGDILEKGDSICKWDPYNAVILSEIDGKTQFINIEEGVTVREEVDEQTGFREKVVTETRDKKKIPTINIVVGKEKEVVKRYSIPVGAHLNVNHSDVIKMGEIIAKIPRVSGKTGDITGGLPRVQELFEARNPTNPAVVSEIDGYVSFGPKIKRGNREIIVESKTGEVKKYLVSLSKHILVQENDFVKAGNPLSDGAITPSDILSIKGSKAVQEYLVNEVQEVYRLQGVKINDKHFEVIVRQMMRKVDVLDSGDTRLLQDESVNRMDFFAENSEIYGKKIITDAGDSDSLKRGEIISARRLRDENAQLKRKDLRPVEARDTVPATARQKLLGITRASLQTDSFISAASFQETTKILNTAAIRGKQDYLQGLKENVIVGHLIPAGSGARVFKNIQVANKEELQKKLDGGETMEEALEKKTDLAQTN